MAKQKDADRAKIYEDACANREEWRGSAYCSMVYNSSNGQVVALGYRAESYGPLELQNGRRNFGKVDLFYDRKVGFPMAVLENPSRNPLTPELEKALGEIGQEYNRRFFQK